MDCVNKQHQNSKSHSPYIDPQAAQAALEWLLQKGLVLGPSELGEGRFQLSDLGRKILTTLELVDIGQAEELLTRQGAPYAPLVIGVLISVLVTGAPAGQMAA